MSRNGLSSSIGQRVRSYKWGARIILGARDQSHLWPSVGRHDVVVEGFPRSGNTWVLAMAMLCWPQAVFASHSHMAGSVKRAFDEGLPVLILWRDPFLTLDSYRRAWPSTWTAVGPDRVATWWIRYYRIVLSVKARDYSGRISIAEFDSRDMGSTRTRVDSILARYLGPPSADVSDESVFRALERRARESGHPANQWPLPSAERPVEKGADLAAVVRPSTLQALLRIQALLATNSKPNMA